LSRLYDALKQADPAVPPAAETLAPVQPVRPPQPVQPFPRMGRSPASRAKTPEWILALNVLKKHWRLSALFAALVMVTVIIVTFSMRALYEPSARIEVDPPGETFSLDGGNGPGNDDAYVETQAQNLKSDKLAVAVIRQLNLDQNIDLVPDAEERAQSRRVANPQSDDVLQLTPAENTALAALRSRLTIRRDTASRLITVSFADYDPQLAAQVANTVVNLFIEQGYQEQHDSITKSTQWLSKQLDDIRTRMEDSNRVLADFQNKIGVADLDDNKSTFSEQMEDLNRQLTQAEADRIQIEAMLKNVRVGSADWLPEVRDNPVVQQLSEKLADARSQLSQALVVYGKNHPNTKKLQNQVDELDKQLSDQKLAIVSSIRSSYDAAHAREQLMNSQIKGATSQLNQIARYNALKKDAQANSELYNTLYARVKEAGIAAASKSSNLRVVDEARVLDSPTRPNRPLNLMVGLMAALAGAVALAFLREQLDARIFTPEDMQHSAGTANISIVPEFFLSSQKQLPQGIEWPTSKVPANVKGENFGPWVRLLLEQPHSPGAEALRALYTSVVLSRAENPPQVAMVVSSLPGEGKTTVAVNLAIAMAQHGPTCLVDADLRQGRVASELGIRKTPGLSDVLAKAVSLENACVAVSGVPNLYVIPAHPGNPKAGQLICSETMSQVLSELRSQFRFVVVDTAPLLPFADGRALSTLVDGLVFVGRSGITTHHVMRRSLELLEEVKGAPVLEFVLNAADINSAQYRYYQYGYEYYRSSSK
jgi:succinoglycan biosynthesis transport protein ExoP